MQKFVLSSDLQFEGLFQDGGKLIASQTLLIAEKLKV